MSAMGGKRTLAPPPLQRLQTLEFYRAHVRPRFGLPALVIHPHCASRDGGVFGSRFGGVQEQQIVPPHIGRSASGVHVEAATVSAGVEHEPRWWRAFEGMEQA